MRVDRPATIDPARAAIDRVVRRLLRQVAEDIDMFNARPILSALGMLLGLAALGGCDPGDAAAAPVAADDRATTPRDTPVALSLIANDVAFAPATLDVRSLDLDPATPGAQQWLTTEAGSYFLDCLGDVRFEPAAGFTGDAATPYTIADSQGRASAAAFIVVTVGAD